jgi:hypothetical protein
MTASITLVLFDMEGVLSHYDRSARVDHLSAVSGQAAETVRHAIWGSGLEARADAGQISDDEYLSELGDLLSCRINRNDWLAARRASITPYAEVLALAARVAERNRIALPPRHRPYRLFESCGRSAVRFSRLCLRFVRCSEANGSSLSSMP